MERGESHARSKYKLLTRLWSAGYTMTIRKVTGTRLLSLTLSYFFIQ